MRLSFAPIAGWFGDRSFRGSEAQDLARDRERLERLAVLSILNDRLKRRMIHSRNGCKHFGRRGIDVHDARLELLRQADRVLVAEQNWVVPVLYDGFAVLHRRNLEGLWSNPMGMSPLDEVVVDRSA